MHEMLRIAKPGAPVIIELNAPNICESDDFGGVNSDYWTTGAATYGWDIVQSSIKTEKYSHLDRYHVFMMKNAIE
jgi:hypothetical protein